MGSGTSKGTTRVLVQNSSSYKDNTGPDQHFTEEVGKKPSNNNNEVNGVLEDLPEDTNVTNTFIENVFLITTGKTSGNGLPIECVMLKEMSKKLKQTAFLNSDNIEEAVFERLLIANPKGQLVKRKTGRSLLALNAGTASEPCVFVYLFQCYQRFKFLQKEQKFASIDTDITKCKEVIYLNAKTSLQRHELFAKQNVQRQFIDVCLNNTDHLLDTTSEVHAFLMETVTLLESDKENLSEALKPVLEELHKTFKGFGLMNPNIGKHLLILRFFACRPSLGELFMDFSEPSDWTVAFSYETTLIGAVLSLSSCPKNGQGPYEFFNNPIGSSSHDINTTIRFIWQKIDEICDQMFRVLFYMVRYGDELKHKVVRWLSRCLKANRGKPDIWSAHEVEVFSKSYCSDGFCLNLCSVMLLFCHPFTESNTTQMFKIKPTYCKVKINNEQEEKQYSVHARGLYREKTFTPYTDDSYIDTAKDYYFITECYFLTQQALHIGYSIVFKIIKLNNNINRLDKLHSEIKDVYSRKVVELVKQQLNKEMCWYLNIKAAITEYHLTKMCLNFHISSATWLVQIATRGECTSFEPVVFPLTKTAPKILSYLPEFVMTNITNFIVSMELFRMVELLKADIEGYKNFVTMILVFMGSPERLTNSDIRAQLAESLETVLPKLKGDGTWEASPSGNEEVIFKEHPLIGNMAEALLNVFVSIEMTGQSVDSEKKFNYRKSMHKVLQYIWKIPLHKEAIKKLSSDALANIDNTDPPLFLRFINLLINDAIFLLDEALDHMKKIKEQEQERDRGEWNTLSAEQFRDKETGLRHLGMMGRFRNAMANHTIYSLELITRDIRDIFCHSVMVDRIAGMLNYFLEHLVGPKQKDYKVKDRREYEFKPEQVVSDIAHIYLYLGKNEQFCKAVLGETRSFSQVLFQQALAVLTKIGVAADFIKRFEDLSKKFESMEVEHKKDGEILAEAPEEFLDPIMGSLMEEPVVLPTSKTTIDKAVIARHLLSDQTDPFTKQPLTMDMVIPDAELKQKITRWIKEQKSKQHRMSE